MDISGKIVQFLPAQTGQGKNGPWKKQEFILETGDTYPKKICIAVWGDKIDLSSFKPGDTIDVSFDVESREYNGRWYTDVKAWKVSGKQSGGQQSGGQPTSNNYSSAPFQGNTMNAGTDDDLPF
jgi:hypothetical protein